MSSKRHAHEERPEGPCHCCDSRRLLGDLECPFTWAVPPLSPMETAYNEDKMFIWAEPYVAAADKIALAYSRFCEGRHWEARAHLVDMYLYMLHRDLNSESWTRRCPVYDDYREGFRHVVDACWAGMCLPGRSEYRAGQHVRRADDPDSSVEAFIKTITPFRCLALRQRAAALTLKSRFMTDSGLEELLRKCLKYDPREGAWKHLLGWSLQDQRGKLSTLLESEDGKMLSMIRGPDGKIKVVEGLTKPEPSREEVALLRDAYRLRPNPDTMTRLAKTLIESTQFSQEGKALLDQSMSMYPDCPAVFFQVLNIYPTMPEMWEKEEKVYERLLKLTKDNAHIYMKMGMRYMSRKNQDKANSLFMKGLMKNKLAAQAFLEMMKGTASASKDTCKDYTSQHGHK